MTPPSAAPARPRRTLWIVLGGCAALAACACVVAAAAGGVYYLNSRPKAQEPTVAYILDTSARMAEPSEGGTKLEVARGVMAEIVRPAHPGVTAGLRVFGSGAEAEACRDTQLVVPFATANQPAIAESLDGLQAGAQGDASLAEAMIRAIRDLAQREGPQSLVVVTGGADSCSPDAAAIIAREAEQAGIRLQTYVVGFEVSDQEAEAIKSMVETSTDSTFYSAPDAASLRSILTTIQTQVDATATGVRSTACDHPYFPIRQGAVWNYSGEGYEYSWRVTGISGDMTNATATIVAEFGFGPVTYTWSCSAGGVQHYTMADLGVGTFEITSSEGAALLPPGEFRPGVSWSNSYTITSTIGIEGIGVTITTDVSENHTAGDPFDLSTGLGTFIVIPVSSTSSMNSTGDFGDISNSFSSTVYYAQDVGILRVETTTEGATFTTDLVSFSIPPLE